MDTIQLYSFVNSINKSTLGLQDIQVVDTNSFIALGDTVLSSTTNTEAWLNTLTQRFIRAIMSYRPYSSPMRELAFSSDQWGAILQKVKVDMPDAIEDVSVDLKDGQSIDPYIVQKPKAHQKLFVVRSPFTFMRTIQRDWLYEAFQSEGEMERFIGMIFGELMNKMELSQENLAHLAIANFIGNMGNGQKIHLLTQYKAVSGDTSITAATALVNESFLRYAMGQLKLYSEYMQRMSTKYNKEAFTRHSPIVDQRFITRADFKIAMETQVEYAAFHTEYLEKAADVVLPYWQSPDAPDEIKVTNADDEEVEVANILALIHDREAIGTFRKRTDSYTTPFNARGRYYNVFYHINDARLNDLSENGLLFLLD